MPDTEARLLGPEGELEYTMMISGTCPPVIYAAAPPRAADLVLSSLTQPLSISFEKVEYVQEFVLPGIATYRRKLTWRTPPDASPPAP